MKENSAELLIMKSYWKNAHKILEEEREGQLRDNIKGRIADIREYIRKRWADEQATTEELELHNWAKLIQKKLYKDSQWNMWNQVKHNNHGIQLMRWQAKFNFVRTGLRE